MLLQIALAALSIYFYFLYKFSYWKWLGFAYVPGKFPIGSVSGIGLVEHATDYFFVCTVTKKSSRL
jgi:hypothetical protein